MPGYTFTYYDSTGLAYPLNDDVDWYLKRGGMYGFGVLRPELATMRTPYTHGVAEIGTPVTLAREMSIALLLSKNTYADWHAALRTLRRNLNTWKGDGGTGRLGIVTPDGLTRYIDCRCIECLEPEMDGPVFGTVVLSFWAKKPWFYDTTEESVVVWPGGAMFATIPMTLRAIPRTYAHKHLPLTLKSIPRTSARVGVPMTLPATLSSTVTRGTPPADAVKLHQVGAGVRGTPPSDAEKLSTIHYGVKIPMTLPSTISSQIVRFSKTVTNAGDIEVWPVITVIGPARTPMFRNETTGAIFRLLGSAETTIGVGDTITIDMGAGTVKANRSGAEVNLINYMTQASTFWTLRQGENVISGEIWLSPAGSATISYDNLYIAL